MFVVPKKEDASIGKPVLPNSVAVLLGYLNDTGKVVPGSRREWEVMEVMEGGRGKTFLSGRGRIRSGRELALVKPFSAVP